MMDAIARGQRARELFLEGFNCCQSVVLAFDDVLAERGISRDMAGRISSSFGGGVGRMREVCGAVSAMSMILGIVEGYSDPEAYDEKKQLYERVQELAKAYKDENGSIICRELLGLNGGPSEATPERRSEEYYSRRPCVELCASAARILAERL